MKKTHTDDTTTAEVTTNTADVATADKDPNKGTAKDRAKAVRGKKRRKQIKKAIIWIFIIVIVAVALLFHFGVIGGKNSTAAGAETYTTFTVMRRDIQNVLTGTGTLQPYDSYTVTALASGEIIEDYFEEGDEVTEDELLMKIDSSNLDTSLERAENSYKDAQEALNDLYESREDLNVVSDYSGVIQVLNPEVGDDINAGTVVASIIDRDTMLIDIPFMQADSFYINKGDAAVLTVGDTLEEIAGTVDKISPSYSVNENGVKTVNITIAALNPGAITESTVATAKIGDYSCTNSSTFYYNVNETVTSEISGEVARIVKGEGEYVKKGDVILVLESESLEDSIEKAEDNLKDAKNNLEDAQDAFDNYEITAPISGTVIEKNYKKGEKIGSSSGGGNSVAVIYDMSALKFDMNIDELDIDDLAIGQTVNITSDAKPGITYIGSITKISVQGTTSNGTTYYPITVTLTDYGQNTENTLRAGMNIDAEIILEKVENALVIPVDAVGRGNKVKVIRKTDDGSADAGAADEASDNNISTDSAVQNGERPDGAFRPDGNMPETDRVPTAGDESESIAPTVDGENTAGTIPTDSNTPTDGRPTGERSELSADGEMTETPVMPEKPEMPQRQNGGYGTAPIDSEYEEITVETGISDEDFIEIISGLEEGDMVIVESAAAASNAWGNMGAMGMGMGGMPNMGGGMPNMGGGMSARPAGGMGGGMPGGR